MFGWRIAIAALAAIATGVPDRHVSFSVPAAEAQEIGAPQAAPDAIGKGRLSTGEGPTIDRVSISPDGTGIFEGASAPRALIALTMEGRAIGETIADARGGWRLSLVRGLAAGEHRIEAVARTEDTREPYIGEVIRISIPDGFGSDNADPRWAAGASDQDLLRRAGELAEAASRRFDELLPELARRPERGERVAQAETQPKGRPAAQPQADDGLLAPAWAWLERASKEYQNVIVRRLSVGGEPAAQGAAKAPAVRQPMDAKTTAPVGGQPQAASPSRPVAAIDRKQPGQAVDSDGSMLDEIQQWLGSNLAGVQWWLETSERNYQTAIVRRLSDPAPTGPTTVAQAPVSVVRVPAADARQAGETAEAARRAEAEQRRQSEAKKAELAKVEAAKQRAAEEETKRKAAEAQRLAAAEAAKTEAAKQRAAEEEARRKAEAQRQAAAKAEAEAKRKAAEEVRRQQQAQAPARAGVAAREQSASPAKGTRTASLSKRERASLGAVGMKPPRVASKKARKVAASRQQTARRDRPLAKLTDAVQPATAINYTVDGLCSIFQYPYLSAFAQPEQGQAVRTQRPR